MYLLNLIVFLNLLVSCHTIEDGWKGIRPLRTDKATVEKLLGKPEVDDNGYYRYRTGEAFIRINYSSTPCENNKMNRGKFNVPKDTVLDYYVRPLTLTPLSNLKFKKEQYYRDASGDTNSILLISNEYGVMIGIQDQEGIEYFSGVDFKASKKDAEYFKCSESIKGN